MNRIAWIIFGAAVIAIIGGLVIFSRATNPPADVSNVDVNSIIAASTQNGNIGDHVLGTAGGKVTIIEYGDFQCPSCGAAHPQIKAIAEEYKDKIAFVFRNFPLTTIHPNARAASAAAEAAGLQGKYWEMHDLLFESQSEWSSLAATERTDTFKAYAEEIGLDLTKFASDLASSNVNQKISFDQALGKKVSITATPTFFLNGEQLEPSVANAVVQGSTTELKALIESKLAN